MREILLIIALLAATGCTQADFDKEPAPEASLFSAASMRVHPIFTQVKDWTNDGKPDGVEVLMEFQDQFGDPAKAAGSIMFELYDFRQGNSEPRGQRLANPWIGSIGTVEEQRSRWNRTSRTYTFQLAYPAVDLKKSYVLTATFRAATGGRLFDHIVLQGEEESIVPSTQPSTKPAGKFP